MVSLAFHCRRGKKKGQKGQKQQAKQNRWQLQNQTEDDRRRRAERFRATPKVGVLSAVSSRRRAGVVEVASSRIYQDMDDIICLDYGASGPDPVLSHAPIVGLCEDVEKPFFRLTTAADPADVRPERVLRRSLENVKLRWKEERNYAFAQSQLRYPCFLDCLIGKSRN